MDDDFIETLITPESQQGDSKIMYREFRGIEAVQHNEESDDSTGDDE